MFKPNQDAAIRKLEAALLSCKRAGLALCGIDNNLFVIIDDEAFAAAVRDRSPCEVTLARHNSGDINTKGHYSVSSDDAGTLKKDGATIVNAGLNQGR